MTDAVEQITSHEMEIRCLTKSQENASLYLKKNRINY